MEKLFQISFVSLFDLGYAAVLEVEGLKKVPITLLKCSKMYLNGFLKIHCFHTVCYSVR